MAKKAKIVDGTDKSKLEARQDYRRRMVALAQAHQHPWNGRTCKGPGVYARIDYGRWIADCECGGAEYVTPEDAIFYCASCGNAITKGDARPVIFPEPAERAEIEALLLARPVDDTNGKDEAERAMRAKPLAGLARSWKPGITVEQLRDENKKMKQKPEK